METLTLTSGTLQQKTLDKVGYDNHYQELYFKKGSYTVKTPLKLSSGTHIFCEDGAVINLIANASMTTFPAGTPIFGQNESIIKDITIENIRYNGNSGKQIVSHGKNFHTMLGLKCASNITVRNILAQDTQGDIVRIETGKDIFYYGNTILGCGHDSLYTQRATNVDAYDNVVYLRSNSALRCKGSHDVKFHNNRVYRTNAYSPAFSPGTQIENSRNDETASNIEIYENYIEGTFGPGVWIIGNTNPDTNAASGVTVRNNIIVNCGQMPAESKISGVGGIVCDGVTDVNIVNNTIDSCLGFGILFGSYVTNSAGSGYTATVSKNIITNTKKGYYPKTASGTGIANLLTNKYTVDASENCIWNSEGQDMYKVTDFDVIQADPLYVGNGDYHLQSRGGHYTPEGYILDSASSPCVQEFGELGRYAGSQEASIYIPETNLSPSEVIGDNPAIILVCWDDKAAVRLSEAIERSELLTSERMYVYLPK